VGKEGKGRGKEKEFFFLPAAQKKIISPCYLITTQSYGYPLKATTKISPRNKNKNHR
jgi:hypothetical protein